MLSEVFSPTDLFGQISTIMGVMGMIAGFICILIFCCKKKRLSVLLSLFLSLIGSVVTGIVTYILIRFLFWVLIIGVFLMGCGRIFIGEAMRDIIDDFLDRFGL